MNKKHNNITIVGAGGIGCHLIPMLAFLSGKTRIIDGDSYEPENCTRQFPALKETANKAQTMAHIVRERSQGIIEWRGEYITPQNKFELIDPETSLIVSCVDNNETRNLLAGACYSLGVPGIMAGNSDTFGEAHLVLPPDYDPFQFFDFPMKGRQPWGCNTDKELDERPQTAVANMLAAGAAMAIFNSLCADKKPEHTMAWCHVDGPKAQSKRVIDLFRERDDEEKVKMLING